MRGVLHRVAVAAEDLQRVAGNFFNHVGCEQLGHASFQIGTLAGIFLLCCEVGELAGGFDVGRHVGQLVLDDLELGDRLAKLFAFLGILQRRVKGSLRHADRARRGLNARRLVDAHQLVEAAPLHPADQVLGRHLEILEVEAERLHAVVADGGNRRTGELWRDELIARCLLHHEHRQPLVALADIGIGTRQHGHDMGAVGEGDPRLGAVEQIAAVGLLDSAQLHAGRVGASIRLGERRCGQDVPGRDARQPAFFLRVRPAV